MSSISQQGGDSETARAIARPPFLFLVALLLGFVSDHLLPLLFPISRIGLAHWISAGVAGFLIFIGVGVFAAGIHNFSSAATPRWIMERSKIWLDGATTPSVIPACKRGGFCRSVPDCSFAHIECWRIIAVRSGGRIGIT